MSRPFANENAFRAIADPTRRRVLDLLRRGDCTVGEIALAIRIPFVNLSPHLRVLRTAGLIKQRRRGVQRVYGLSVADLRYVSGWIQPFEPFWRTATKSPDK